MTRDEAKFRLQAYRPGGQDAMDPEFAEALQHVRADPDLQAWFAREQEHAALMGAKLRTLVPPAELRETLLAGSSVSVRRRRRIRIWRPPVAWAIAAAVALLISASAWWIWAPVPGATLDEFAANFVARRFLLRERSSDVAALKQWLVQHGAPIPAELPPRFARLRALGCRTVLFDGREVSLICFNQDGHEFHVFVARRDELGPDRVPVGPSRKELRDHRLVWWLDHEHVFVLVSDAPAPVVERLL